MAKLSSVSHDSSKTILIYWFSTHETFLIITAKKTLLLLNICNNFILWTESSNVFTVTFDQFNASLLNKSIHFFKKKKILLNQTFERQCIFFRIKALHTSKSFFNWQQTPPQQHQHKFHYLSLSILTHLIRFHQTKAEIKIHLTEKDLIIKKSIWCSSKHTLDFT